MILVRTEMNCKWGRIQEAIATFKAMAEQIDTQDVIKRARLLTDLSGRFDTLIIESEVESLDASSPCCKPPSPTLNCRLNKRQ